mgnify:CR=1 FL=1
MTQLENAKESLMSIDLSMVSEIQRMLKEKESLQAEIAQLQEQKQKLVGDVLQLKKERKQAINDESRNPSTSGAEGSDKENDEENDGKPPKVPDHFLCPLTLEVMKTPMQHKVTKHNYERKAIFEWIYFGKATCPLTRRKLHPQDFIENYVLQREIEEWKLEHNYVETDDDDDSSDDDDESDNGGSGQDWTAGMTPEQEKHYKTHCKGKKGDKIKRVGSHGSLLDIRDRVLRNRDLRVRRMSGGGLE